jgi:hypothetical protein
MFSSSIHFICVFIYKARNFSHKKQNKGGRKWQASWVLLFKQNFLKFNIVQNSPRLFDFYLFHWLMDNVCVRLTNIWYLNIVFLISLFPYSSISVLLALVILHLDFFPPLLSLMHIHFSFLSLKITKTYSLNCWIVFLLCYIYYSKV